MTLKTIHTSHNDLHRLFWVQGARAEGGSTLVDPIGGGVVRVGPGEDRLPVDRGGDAVVICRVCHGRGVPQPGDTTVGRVNIIVCPSLYIYTRLTRHTIGILSISSRYSLIIALG